MFLFSIVLIVFLLNAYFICNRTIKLNENEDDMYCYFNFDGQELRVPVPSNSKPINVGDIATVKLRCKNKLDEISNNGLILRVDKIIKVDESTEFIPDEDTDFYISNIVNIQKRKVMI